MDTKNLSAKIENRFDELIEEIINCLKEGKSSNEYSFDGLWQTNSLLMFKDTIILSRY